MQTVTIDFWAPFACFTPPYANVERYSYDVPTPSALRGALASIYSKPSEFYWTINKIEVMNPIRRVSCKCNEVEVKAVDCKPIDIEANRSQRMMSMLADVRYRVTATINPQKPGKDFEIGLWKQATRRIKHGQCVRQPYLGMSDFICYFELSDHTGEPIKESRDFGLMTYDTHVPSDNTRGGSDIDYSLYHCEMVNGVILVPDYDDDTVLKVSRPKSRKQVTA